VLRQTSNFDWSECVIDILEALADIRSEMVSKSRERVSTDIIAMEALEALQYLVKNYETDLGVF
jgi:hypothetical protein